MQQTSAQLREKVVELEKEASSVRFFPYPCVRPRVVC